MGIRSPLSIQQSVSDVRRKALVVRSVQRARAWTQMSGAVRQVGRRSLPGTLVPMQRAVRVEIKVVGENQAVKGARGIRVPEKKVDCQHCALQCGGDRRLQPGGMHNDRPDSGLVTRRNVVNSLKNCPRRSTNRCQTFQSNAG